MFISCVSCGYFQTVDVKLIRPHLTQHRWRVFWREMSILLFLERRWIILWLKLIKNFWSRILSNKCTVFASLSQQQGCQHQPWGPCPLPLLSIHSFFLWDTTTGHDAKEKLSKHRIHVVLEDSAENRGVGASPNPSKLGEADLKGAEQSEVEWVRAIKIGGIRSSCTELSPASQAAARSQNSRTPGAPAQLGWPHFWGVVHCFLLSCAQGLEGAGSVGTATTLATLMAVLGPSWGGKHLFVSKAPSFFYTLVTNIAAVTVHFLFHGLLLSVNCYPNP